MLQYMNHCRNLHFEQKPDYDQLRQLIMKMADREGYDLEDGMYDWVIKENKGGMNLIKDAPRAPKSYADIH